MRKSRRRLLLRRWLRRSKLTKRKGSTRRVEMRCHQLREKSLSPQIGRAHV